MRSHRKSKGWTFGTVWAGTILVRRDGKIVGKITRYEGSYRYWQTTPGIVRRYVRVSRLAYADLEELKADIMAGALKL